MATEFGLCLSPSFQLGRCHQRAAYREKAILLKDKVNCEKLKMLLVTWVVVTERHPGDKLWICLLLGLDNIFIVYKSLLKVLSHH
jgi:hypothetical protein